MTDPDAAGDGVHVLDVDSDFGEPPLDSAVRSAAAAAEMPPPSSSTKASNPSSRSPSISASSTRSTSTSSAPSFALSDRSVATAGGALLATLLLLLIAAVFLRARRPPGKNRRSAAGTRAALIAGPSGSGKTTLFLELTKKKKKGQGTVASMTENEGVAAVLSSSSSSSSPGSSKNSLRRVAVVDAPGHPRLRALAASRAPSATSIVFVVDSSDFLPRKADAAEALAGLLAGSWRRRKKGVAVLLACNKSDRGEAAHSPDFIRRRLEKEIEALVASAATGGLAGEERGSGGGGGGGDEGDLASLLRRAGEPFTFAGLAKAGGPALETCVCSALEGEIASVSGFLAKNG